MAYPGPDHDVIDLTMTESEESDSDIDASVIHGHADDRAIEQHKRRYQRFSCCCFLNTSHNIGRWLQYLVSMARELVARVKAAKKRSSIILLLAWSHKTRYCYYHRGCR